MHNAPEGGSRAAAGGWRVWVSHLRGGANLSKLLSCNQTIFEGPHVQLHSNCLVVESPPEWKSAFRW